MVAPPAATPTANTGSVSTAFVAGATPRYHSTYAGGQSFGRLDPHVQNSNGAMTILGNAVLSGDAVTKDISGDATCAMGRWMAAP